MENDDINDFEETMSSKYRRFLITGIGRVIVTRLVSLLYILYISRSIPSGILDNMIFLAQGQYISIQISVFGMSYALTKINFDENLTLDDIYPILFSTAVIGVPLVAISSVGLGIYSNIGLTNILVFTISSLLQYLLELGVLVNNIKLSVEKGILALSLYSILNSLSVPAFYFYFETLTSVFLAWNFSFIFPILYLRKSIIPTLTKFKTTYSRWKEIFLFGWPIYVSNIYAFIVARLDTIVLYVFFETGEASQYYLIFRIAQIGQEFLMTVISGLGPLLMAIYNKQNKDQFNALINSMLRISIFVGSIYYAYLLMEADIIIFILLSSRFLSGLPILKIIFVAFFIDINVRMLNNVYGAEGHRRIMFIKKIMVNTLRILFIVIFSSFGAIGLAIAFLLTRVLGSFYYLFHKISILKKSEFIRVVLLSIIFLVMSQTIEFGFSIANVTVEVITFTMLSIGLIYVFKPLTIKDWDFVDRIIGERFVWLKAIIFRLIVNEDHST